MATFLIYILKVAFCQALFWTMYRLLLSHDTFHAFNRLVLWVFQALAFVLPLCPVPAATLPSVSQGVPSAVDAVFPQAATVSTTVVSLPTVQVAFLIYIIGVVLLSAFSLFSIFRILMLTRGGRRVRENDGMDITTLSHPIAPFSWIGRIVVGQTENEEDHQAILLHESAHVRLRHSWDTVANDLLTLLTWFSPFAWLLRRELKEVHEYEADAAVLRQGIDPKRYQMLLIRKTAGEHLFAIANNFHYNSLKKRITMMNTTKSNPWLCVKAALALPLAFAALAVFASPKVAAISMEAKAEISEEADTLRLPAIKAEVPPTYPGGESALLADFSEALVNPQSAIDQKLSGSVLAEFEIRTDGSIGRIEIKKSLSPDCDNAVIASIRKFKNFNPAMQNGKPVTTWFALPVTFKNN